MSDKKFGILIRNSPYNNLRVVEAMRLGLGLTTRDIQVHLFFLEAGLIALKEAFSDQEDEPIFLKHLKMLAELEQTLVAEADSVAGDENSSKTLGIVQWKRSDVFMFLTQCDGVVFV